MSKELEALESLGYVTVDEMQWQGNHDYKKIKDTERYAIIKKALTPPTADEVCQEIISFFKTTSYHNHITTAYYSSVSKKFYAEDYPNLLDVIDNNYYLFHLPPHLITLIGRFYEGLEQ